MIRKPSAGDASESEWFKSSYSDSSSGNNCIEVASTPGAVHVRDSKNQPGPRLTFGADAWAGFITHVVGR